MCGSFARNLGLLGASVFSLIRHPQYHTKCVDAHNDYWLMLANMYEIII